MFRRDPNFLILILSILFACSKPKHVMDYRNLSGNWLASEKVVFDIDYPSDQLVNMMIYIRNNSQYPFSNLFLIARLQTGDSVLLCDTLEYAMANEQGQWLGRGFLEAKESKLSWKENYELPKADNLYVKLEHALRFNGNERGMDTLQGILGVGFAIEEILKHE